MSRNNVERFNLFLFDNIGRKNNTEKNIEFNNASTQKEITTKESRYFGLQWFTSSDHYNAMITMYILTKHLFNSDIF